MYFIYLFACIIVKIIVKHLKVVEQEIVVNRRRNSSLIDYKLKQAKFEKG